MRYSGIGGQAVLEGVMMRNKNKYAVAVRKPDKDIEVKVSDFKSLSDRYSFLKLPLLRGVVNFVESLYIGMKALSFASEFIEEEDMTAKKETKDKKDGLITALVVTFSIALAIGIFMILPYGISLLFQNYLKSNTALTILEGVIRLILLIAYMVGISFVPDIKRVYMYHGAEHKTINCVEEGLPLSVKNVRKMTRKHLRCGTSFIIDVIILSIILFMFIRVENVLLRLAFRVLLVPVIAAVAYEFLRIAGSSSNPVVRFLSIPGLWFQSLTTKEPDDGMIEVAIKSVEAVFDREKWISQTEEKPSSKKPVEEKEEKAKGEIPTMEEEDTVKKTTKNKKEKNRRKQEISKKASGESQKGKLLAEQKKAGKEDTKLVENFAMKEADEEEDDEILNALDRFFNSHKVEDKDKVNKG